MCNKRKKRGGRILAAVMAALLLAVVSPSGVLAQEQTADEVTSLDEPADQPGKTEVLQEETPDDRENGSNIEAGEVSEETGEEETTDETAQSGDTEDETPETIPEIVTPVVLPMTEGEQYEQLSTFLALSSDRFEIYMVAFLDAGQNQVHPEEPVQILLDIPQDYDMQRLEVSEVTVDGSTPVRTELPFEVREGKAAITVGHTGVYAVMEKKIMQELPAYLEPTAKVEKLTVAKNSAASGSMYFGTVNSSVPLTGDDSSVAVWIIIMAAAVVAVIFIIIRKKK